MTNVTIYTRAGCPWCERACDLFESLGVPHQEVRLDGDDARRAELSARYAWKTVPMIVVGERFLGGFSDVEKLHREGGLMPLLADVRA